MTLNLQTREHLSELIVAITKTGDLYLDPIQTKVNKQVVAMLVKRVPLLWSIDSFQILAP